MSISAVAAEFIKGAVGMDAVGNAGKLGQFVNKSGGNSQSGTNSPVVTVGDLQNKMTSQFQKMDRGFYGHMEVKGTKKDTSKWAKL